MSVVFLSAYLPPLDIHVRPEMSFEELWRSFTDNLSQGQIQKLLAVRTFIDLQNLEKLYRHFPIDPRGTLSEEELIQEDLLPEYVKNILSSLDSEEEKLKAHPKIMAAFFLEPQHGFLQRYYAFEKQFRLTLTALRCKKQKIDPAYALKEEDPREGLVAQILAAKDQPTFEMPFEFQDFGVMPTDPFEQYLKVAKYRLDKIDELVVEWPFSLSHIAGYLLQFMIVEDYHALNAQKGNALLYDNVCNR